MEGEKRGERQQLDKQHANETRCKT